MKVLHVNSTDTVAENQDGELFGERKDAYLSRYYLFGGGDFLAWQVLVNAIRRIDTIDCHHDHPWDFWTLVLWGGYVESVLLPDGTKKVQRRWPGQLSFRPAEHTHIITELPWGTSWTLVWQRAHRRQYGYHTREGWMHWKKFIKRVGKRGVAWCRPLK